jgi:hypothetical protein
MDITTEVLTGVNTDWRNNPIYIRPGGSYVIHIADDTPYHVPGEGLFVDLHAAIQAYVEENPEAVQPEPEPEPVEWPEPVEQGSGLSDLVKLAILEIHERLTELETINEITPPVKEKDVISDLYFDAINRGLKTIDEVPEARRASVELARR